MNAGKIIGDKYKIISVIGRGGTSVVYLAENVTLGNRWAVKVLQKNSPVFLSELRETTMLKDLSHPMLPRVTDYFEDGSSCYIVMDYISGVNLLDYMRENGPIDERNLIQWTKELLDLFVYLHGRNPPVIYRDMKPSNIVLGDDGRIRLVDFGTARYSPGGAAEDGDAAAEDTTTGTAATANHDTAAGNTAADDTVYIGTRGYAAPEQYGSGMSCPRTDLYSLGMTLVHLATNIHPLTLGNSIETALKQSGISARFTDFLTELIEPDPDKRPRDAAEALKKIDRIMSGMTGGKFFFGRGRNDADKNFKTVIAVSSVMPNIGTTFVSLALGTFFTKHGYHTILAELNSSGDFNAIKEGLDRTGSLKLVTESCFEAERMIFYPGVADSSRMSRKGADVVILDLATVKNDRVLKELNRADMGLILCPGSFWKYRHITKFRESFGPLINDGCVYAVRSSDRHRRNLKKECKIANIITFPLLDNPFYLSKEEDKVIGQVLERAFRMTGQKVSF